MSAAAPQPPALDQADDGRVGHAGTVATRRFMPLRVLGGTVLMLLIAGSLLLLVARYAGGWGVPYFTFTTERGSTCKNGFTGYTCAPLTLADVEFFGQVDLPDDTAVETATYRATHDYRLDARLQVPAGSAEVGLTALVEAYGKCGTGRPSPLDGDGLERGLRDRQPPERPRDRGTEQSRLPDRHRAARRRYAPGVGGPPVPLSSVSEPRCPRRSRRRGSSPRPSTHAVRARPPRSGASPPPHATTRTRGRRRPGRR